MKAEDILPLGVYMWKESAEIKPLPPREFLGKTCEGKQISENGLVVDVWTWKGIPLYGQVKAGTILLSAITVTKLTEGPAPAEKFAVPPGIKIEAE